MAGLFGRFGYWGVAAGMALESACIPIPSEILLPMGGYLAYTGQITFTQALLAGQVGGMVGSVIAYGIGRYAGRDLLERYGRYLLISRRELAAADAWFTRRGEITVLVARLLPGVRTFISVPAGVAQMEFGRFLFYSSLGMLPWSLAFTYAGYLLGQNWLGVRRYLHRLDLLVFAALAGALLWFLLQRKRR